MKRILCLAAIVSLSIGAEVHAQPVVGDAAPVTPDAVDEGQRHATLAAGDEGFLVVWQAGVGGSSQIRAARITTDGQSLDGAGILVAGQAGGQFEPVVAYGHGTYFVVWSDMRSGDHAVYGATLGTDGAVDPPGGRLLSSESGPARSPSVAATSGGFVVVWAQAAPLGHGFVPRALRVDPAGVAIDGAPLAIADVDPWSAGEDFEHRALRYAICQHTRVAVRDGTAAIVYGGTVGREQGYKIVRTFVDLDAWTVIDGPVEAFEGARTRIHNPEIVAFEGGFLLTWLDYRERGQLGLDEHNAVLLTRDGAATPVALGDEGGRKVLAPSLSSAGLVAFVAPEQNPQNDRRVEHHLVLRALAADGSSSGDTLVETNAAWPSLATHPGGTSLMVFTRVDRTSRNGMLDLRAIELP